MYFPVSPTSSVSIVDRARRPTKTRREEREEKMCVYILMEVTNRGKSTTGAIIFERPCDGIQVSPLSSSVRREAGGIASKVFPSKGERTLFLKKLLVDLMRNERERGTINLPFSRIKESESWRKTRSIAGYCWGIPYWETEVRTVTRFLKNEIRLANNIYIYFSLFIYTELIKRIPQY